jgi:hypothetical protein
MKKERNEKNSNGVRLEEADLFKLDKNRRRCPDRFLSQKKNKRKIDREKERKREEREGSKKREM